MTAQNKGFRTRAQLQLNAPRSISYNITPAAGGCAVHWNGGPVGISATDDHAKCEAHWRADQAYHMKSNGWADIAYTGGFCQHGFCFAGRGFGVRTAANGTNVGNQNYYAFCWLGGTGETPTIAALNALEWWINEARRKGKAGNKVAGHRSFFATACPGGILNGRAALLNNSPLYAPNVVASVPTMSPVVFKKPVRPPTTAIVKSIQEAVRAPGLHDGLWGDGTDKAINAVRIAALIGFKGDRYKYGVSYLQLRIGTKADGAFGPASRAALIRTVHDLQKAVMTSADGAWGPNSETKWRALRAQYYKY